MAAEDPPPPAAGVDVGLPGFTDAAEIARGGFGVVYRAQQPAFGRRVAIKVMTTAVTDERTRLRFERECVAMGMLSDHPNILTVYDAGFTAAGQPYLVMDLMTGGSLRDRIDQQGPRPWQEVLPLAVEIGSALETAHRAGVLHRDIKPENVMVSAYGHAQLGDFGIARLAGGPETRTDSLTASIAHVSPELLAGQRPSVASDVYALGSTLYMLLAGAPAFVRPEDESIIPALARISADPVPDLRERGVPEAFAAYVERLMAKDPAVRFPSAEAAARAAQDVQQELGEPVSPVVIPDLPPDLPTEPGTFDAPSGGYDVSLSAPLPAAAGKTSEVTAPVPSGTAAEDPNATVRVGATPQLAPPIPAPRPSRTPILVAVGLVLAVALAAVAFAATRGGEQPSEDVDVTAAPTAATVPTTAPTAGATPATPSAEPTTAAPTAPAEEPIAELAAQMTLQLSEVRRIPSAEIPAHLLGRGEYEEAVREHAVGVQEEAIARDGLILVALHAVPADTDLVQLQADLAAEQFLGFFEGGEVFLRGASPQLSALERSVLADELMQGLLDRNFGTEALLEERRDDPDAHRAAESLVRGDQFLSAAGWQQRFLTAAEQSERAADLGLLPDTVARLAPASVRQNLVFPFVAGDALVRELIAADPAPAGGFAELNAAYDDPPATTEQVIHPEAYLERHPAQSVTVDVDPGDGWTALADRTFGEFDLVQLVLALDGAAGIGQTAGSRASGVGTGWGGGQLRAWQHDAGGVAVAIWVAFDTAEDAEEACAALPEWYTLAVEGGGALEGDPRAGAAIATSPTDALALRCGGDTVRLALAPDAATAAALTGA